MTEHELRQLVRDAIARAGVSSLPAGPAAGVAADRQFRQGPAANPSFMLLSLPAGDGPCIIEPAVSCNHCGYCKTYGH
jgi:hypothetical protein